LSEINIRNEKDLVRVGSKPSVVYADMPLTSLTAYSLYWLHEWKIRRTIEAIAVLNWRLFPEQFAMVGFDEYPDAFRTNRSLLQMQPKYRNLLTGSAVKGFSLNERGMEKARELIAALGVPQALSGQALAVPERNEIAARRPRIARSIEPAREVARAKASKLFDKWKLGLVTERDLIHVHALLRIFDHTPASMRARALKDLEDAASKVGDEEALQFLSDVRKTFPQVLTR
jgi:hypothetical protein